MYTKSKRSTQAGGLKANCIRILVLLGALAIVTAIAVLALDGYGVGETYQFDSYADQYKLYIEGSTEYAYGHQGEYLVDYHYEANVHEEEISYASYLYGYYNDYSYLYGGHIGEAPAYIHERPPIYVFDGQIYVLADEYGNITVYPDDVGFGVMFDGYRFSIMLPPVQDDDSISVYLPHGWDYEIGEDSYDHIYIYMTNMDT